MRTTILLATILSLFFALPATAMDCDGYSTSRPEYSTENPTGAAVYYVDPDGFYSSTHMWSIWVYEESNGIPGLQREDEVVDDTCHGQIRGDTIIF